MTNRGVSGQSGQLRFLDLQFEGKKKLSKANKTKSDGQKSGSMKRKDETPVNNGLRPHGGYRGLKQHPPSPYSFNKPEEFHQAMQRDIDRLMEQQIAPSTSPVPTWAVEINNQPSHSGESPLFTNKLLSPSRIESPVNMSFKYNKVKLKERGCSSAPPGGRTTALRYYRPNSTHQYLTSTELKDASKGDANPSLGRPTRTTLLRARQRCNSAPVNSYEVRREKQQKNEQKNEVRKNLITQLNSSLRDMLGEAVPSGESAHSYLMGARYNRAHHIDAKSLNKYGVYMPRNNPETCFVMEKQTTSRKDSNTSPHIPDSGSQPLSSHTAPCCAPINQALSQHTFSRASTSPPPPPQHVHTAQQAWVEHTTMEVSTSPPPSDSQEESGDNTATNNSVPSNSCHGNSMKQQVIHLNDGLNIKGVGFSGTGSRSSRPFTARPTIKDRRPQQSRGLPSVYIQGTAFNRLSSKSNRDSVVIEHAPPTSSTPASTQSCHNKKPNQGLTVRDISEKLKVENIYVTEGNGSDCIDLLERENDPCRQETSVNVPSSIVDNEGHKHSMLDTDKSEKMTINQSRSEQSYIGVARPKTASTKGIANRIEALQKQDAQAERVSVSDSLLGQSETIRNKTPILRGSPISASASSRVQSARVRPARVRFADDIAKDNKEEGNGKVTFFLTEDEHQKNTDDNSIKVNSECSCISKEARTKNKETEKNSQIVDDMETEMNNELLSMNKVSSESDAVVIEKSDILHPKAEGPQKEKLNNWDSDEVLSLSSEENQPYVIGVDITSKSSNEQVSSDSI